MEKPKLKFTSKCISSKNYSYIQVNLWSFNLPLSKRIHFLLWHKTKICIKIFSLSKILLYFLSIKVLGKNFWEKIKKILQTLKQNHWKDKKWKKMIFYPNSKKKVEHNNFYKSITKTNLFIVSCLFWGINLVLITLRSKSWSWSMTKSSCCHRFEMWKTKKNKRSAFF